jgi:hypothetical protein
MFKRRDEDVLSSTEHGQEGEVLTIRSELLFDPGDRNHIIRFEFQCREYEVSEVKRELINNLEISIRSVLAKGQSTYVHDLLKIQKPIIVSVNDGEEHVSFGLQVSGCEVVNRKEKLIPIKNSIVRDIRYKEESSHHVV